MKKLDVLERIDDLINKRPKAGQNPIGFNSSALAIIKYSVGENNPFFEACLSISKKPVHSDTMNNTTLVVLKSFRHAVETDLISNVSVQRKAQIDVVSDYLSQANDLLSDTSFHPAAAAVLIGASLEEFLRNWCEEEGKTIAKSDTIDSYSKYLLSKELLDKQDMKEITAWGGHRNNAAHGQWDKVENREQIGIMLDGVNLFIQKKSMVKAS